MNIISLRTQLQEVQELVRFVPELELIDWLLAFSAMKATVQTELNRRQRLKV
jgi:hypothetical protein